MGENQLFHYPAIVMKVELENDSYAEVIPDSLATSGFVFCKKISDRPTGSSSGIRQYTKNYRHKP